MPVFKVDRVNHKKVPEFLLHFSVYCAKCGYGLCKTVRIQDREDGVGERLIRVRPCPRCLREARKAGSSHTVPE